MALRFGTVKRAALMAGVAVTLVGAGRPAWAFDDGYQNVFSSVLTAVGVMPADSAPEIDYRERPPLVVPPKQALVKPEEPGARRSAAWPADPDVIRRRKEAAALHTPVFDFNKNEERMPREEMMKYRAVQEPVDHEDIAPSGCLAFEHSMAKCRPTAADAKAQEDRFHAANPEKKDELTAGVEPAREYLTQPPTGYMKPTKTVKATHEAPDVRKDESNPLATYVHTDSKSIDPLNN